MRTVLVIATVLATLGSTSAPGRQLATAPHHHGRSHAYGGESYGGSNYYRAVSSHLVHRPVQSAHAPRGASAWCGDGSWSFSESHRGTCSHHGGVAHWL